MASGVLQKSILGFERFEEVKPLPTKKLHNPHTKDLVDTEIPTNEFKETGTEWRALFSK
jgi:hypothetical protein